MNDINLVKCPSCGKSLPQGIIACWSCGGIVDSKLNSIIEDSGNHVYRLTAIQRKIMNALKGGKATAIQLSSKTNIDTRKVIPSLVGLSRKGLVVKSINGKTWSAIEEEN